MHTLLPADELAEIRAEIARLKLREAVLRAQFLADPTAPRRGRWRRCVKHHIRHRRILNPNSKSATLRRFDASFSRDSIRSVKYPSTPRIPLLHHHHADADVASSLRSDVFAERRREVRRSSSSSSRRSFPSRSIDVDRRSRTRTRITRRRG